jgi:hypothetical protein
MTDLDELLHAEGRRWQAGFQPPPLDPMVATAQSTTGRSRWAWPILAAVLLLAVPLVTVLLRHSTHIVRPGASAPGSKATSKLKLYGAVPWVQAVSQLDGKSVRVYVDIDKTPNMGCLIEFPVLQASAVETSSQITIRVQAYQPADYVEPTAAPGTVLGCNAIGHLPVPLLVNLGGPIDGRDLVDASTGKTHQPGPAVDLPSLSTLPPGYLDAGSGPWVIGVGSSGIAEHTYRNGGNFLNLDRVPTGRTLLYAVKPVEATGTVLGHPATVGGPGAYRCAAWSDRSYTWQLCSSRLGSETDLLSPGELLALANSIR